MNARAPTLGQRIEDVEERVALRHERLQLRWQDTQDATRGLVRINHSLPLVATGAAILLGYLLLRPGPTLPPVLPLPTRC
jgi:hypothetical protein